MYIKVNNKQNMFWIDQGCPHATGLTLSPKAALRTLDGGRRTTLQSIFDLRRSLICQLQRTLAVELHFIPIAMMREAISYLSSPLADNTNPQFLNRSAGQVNDYFIRLGCQKFS